MCMCVYIGDQLFDSYGRKCNSRLLVNYGFSCDYNEDNRCRLQLSLDKDDEYFPARTFLLGLSLSLSLCVCVYVCVCVCV